ncbi:L-histidine N(alpha)-methyltransferase [Haliangium sp.]|uniref:L-histidine N(alpha)-methyltransferase n=1 Tax=Haliangium sp. TaxID=2663208 RepID=UPI003D0DC1EB
MSLHSSNVADALSDYAPELDEFRADVLRGLAQPQKRLPSKYFYDERGSQLFDRICELDEYYPTRTELAIMSDYVDEMVAAIGPDVLLIEYGSGSSVKTRILLDHLPALAGYAPVDISKEHLAQTSEALAGAYPHIPVYPICADFTGTYELPANAPASARRVVYFPGSTIGNFTADAAQAFLGHIAEVCGAGGGVLIGIDRQKPVSVLEAAYNDAEGVTAAFNLNLLARINRELGADFELARFAHRAAYDADRGCVEMYLVSMVDQFVTVAGHRFPFRAGETIHTEYSHKYTIEGFRALAAPAGLSVTQVWSDPREYFSVLYLEVAGRAQALP